MSYNFDLKKFLVENKLTTNSKMLDEEVIDEGVLDFFGKVKDKLLSYGEKIKKMFSAQEIQKMKNAIEQTLGKSASEITIKDLTVDNAKKIGPLVKDFMVDGTVDESSKELNEGIKGTLGKIFMTLGLTGAAIGSGLVMTSLIPVLAGLVALIVGGVLTANDDDY